MATAIHPDGMRGIPARRDDHALGPTTRRQLDDTPPCVVGLTAFVSVLLAMLCEVDRAGPQLANLDDRAFHLRSLREASAR